MKNVFTWCHFKIISNLSNYFDFIILGSKFSINDIIKINYKS